MCSTQWSEIFLYEHSNFHHLHEEVIWQNYQIAKQMHDQENETALLEMMSPHCILAWIQLWIINLVYVKLRWLSKWPKYWIMRITYKTFWWLYFEPLYVKIGPICVCLPLAFSNDLVNLVYLRLINPKQIHAIIPT